MKEICLTQFLMPNGRKTEVKTNVKDAIAEKARGMILSCEILITGMVALYAKYPDDKDEEEFIRISPNGPEVTKILEDLIEDKWRIRQ